MKKRLLSSLVILCMTTALLTACGKTEKVIEPAEEMWTEVTPAPTEAPTPEPTKEPTKELTPEPTEEPTPTPTAEPTKKTAQAPFADPVAYFDVQLSYTNSCSVDIGMIAIIDPLDETQINIGGVKKGETLSCKVIWPTDKNELKWAVYTQGGDLYSESTTDVTGLTESISITIKGENTIDDIDVDIK